MKINKNILETIKNSNNVAIFTHINPDGDCLGAASALKEAILQLPNKNVDIYCDDNISDNYNYLKHINQVNVPSVNNYDLSIAVDCSDANRMGKYYEIFKSSSKTIKIDHHKTQDNFAQINIVEYVSSTCLILYYYINELIDNINGDIACALYSGISSDTGSFMHSNTTYLEHLVASELLKYDFDFEKVNYLLFKHKTMNQILLQKAALGNMKFLLGGKLGIIYLTNKTLFDTNTKRSDTTGLTDIVTNIDGVLVGVTICEERPGLFSCSFRSKGEADVSNIAEKFGGGGHIRAAGCNIFGHLNTVISKIKEAVDVELKRLHK